MSDQEINFESPRYQTPIFDSLNEQQRLAVAQIHGPMLILAGPGSGKTRVITHRIANMIASDIPSNNILALTFTNKAADEMRRRLEVLAPDNRAWTGTFHKFCARVLRIHAPLVGLAENFTIYDTSDSKKVIKQAIENAEVDLRHYSADRLRNEISNVKNAGVTVEQFEPRPGHALDGIVAKVYPEYQKYLRMANGVDFDDLLLHCVELLRQSPELRESFDRRYAYMMVDEYQDTNTAQYQLIRLLNHSVQNLAVTGDPDQSIYGWRGANLNNILDFERDYPEVKVVRLEQNYRSTKSILEVADQLISNNLRRKKKELVTDNDEGQPVRLVTYPSPQEEATDIADTIALAIQKDGLKPKDFAILYRTNWLSRALEHAMRSSGIPYQIVNGHEFYQRKEIKDLVGYLHLINNPQDSVAFERVINTPSRKIGKVTLGRLRKYAMDNEMAMMEAARVCDQVSTISKAPTGKILQFVQMFDRLSEISSGEVETIIKAVLEETGYRDWLTDDGSEEGFERANNVDELVVAAQEFDNEYAEEGGLERYLEQAALVSDTDVWESSSDYVTMMTLHAAKGLEFPCVYIVGLEDGILPHERSSSDDDQLEEERRLLFVGITRAERQLQVSRCMNRFRRGSYWPVIASRFLMELPRHAMDVFEPASSPLYDDESLADSIEQIDPWLHDGLPEIDINDSEGSLKISIAGSDDGSDDSLANDQDLGTAGMEPKLYRDQEPDDADDQSFGDSDDNSVRETKTLPAGFPRLVTGAQFAQEQEASAATRLHPDSFFIGMDVEHAEYGVGTVMTLSGEGQKRTATVDFKHIGKKRFRLAFSKLSQA